MDRRLQSEINYANARREAERLRELLGATPAGPEWYALAERVKEAEEKADRLWKLWQAKIR